MKSFVSIIIPTYNRAELIGQTLESILAQTYTNWECIVVDDGSTDDTKEVVLSFSDPRIKYFYKKNEERSIARNFGIERSKGIYICFLDSDDIYYKDHLHVLHDFIQKKELPVAMINTGMNVNFNEELRSRPIYDPEKYRHPVYFIWKKFLLINSVCVHRDIFEQHKFPEKFNVWEDTHLWLRIAAAYPFHQIPKITTQWNRHEKSSVSLAFDKVEFYKVKNYLECISNLFQNYETLISSFLNETDRKSYQLEKLKMFMRVTVYNKQVSTFLRLYVYGLQKLDKKKIHYYAFTLLCGSLKKKIISNR